MRMKNVARFFDGEQAFEAYSGVAAFMCQVSSFNDSSADGTTNKRRSMSAAPTVTIPARRTILLGAQRWIVSDGVDDLFQNDKTRVNYNLKKVTDSFKVLTPGQAALAASGTATYAQRYYFKDTSNQLTDNEYDTFWNVFFASDETVSKGSFLRDANNVLFRVRQAYKATEGYLVAQCDELDSDAAQTATFNTGAYNRVTDSFSAGTSAVPVVQFDCSAFFRFRLQAEAQIKPGDKTLFVAISSITPTVGQSFTMLSATWTVLAVQAESDAWACHVRRV